MRMTSEKAVTYFKDETLDFVYIDANHSYESCKQDIALWWPKVKKGGIFSGHDYLNEELPEGSFGVKRAVDEYIKEQKQVLFVISQDWPTWYIIKS